ncbi:MAG: acrylyl-CoA reductase family protein [Acidimicrobiales bacterium]
MTLPEETFDAFVVRHDRTTTPPELRAGIEPLTVGDLPPGDVLVAVEFSAVNYKDGMVLTPGNRVARISPLVPGVDLAGTVVASTAADPELAPGTHVLAHGHDIGVSRHGGFARYARLPAQWVVPLPPGLDARQAMVLGTAGFTAALSVDELERRGLAPPVLVTGAAGGVGSLSVALLATRGYEVVASTGRADAERPWLTGIGAHEVVGRDDIDEEPGRVLGPERFAGAVDCVGGATLARVLRSLRYGAAVAASGLTGGAEVETTVYPFITRQVALLGVDTVQTPRARRLEVWKRLAGDLRPPSIDAFVDSEVALDEVAGALDRIRSGAVRGRVVVRVAA